MSAGKPRTQLLQLRLNTEELEQLLERAGDEPLSSWLRRLALDQPEPERLVHRRRERPMHPQSAELTREVLMASNRLRGVCEVITPRTDVARLLAVLQRIESDLRRVGFSGDQMTAHGFRATARTLLAEMGWRPDAIERQLAHKQSGPLGAAYDRAEFLQERRAMMQAWADYLDQLKSGNTKVVPIRSVAA